MSLRSYLDELLDAVGLTDPQPVAYVDQEIAVSEDSIYNKWELAQWTPDELVQKKGFKVYRQMMTDDTIAKSMATIKMLRTSSGWIIEPASQAPEDQEVRDFIKDQLENVEGGFKDDIKGMMGAHSFGWSLQEIVLKSEVSGRWAGKIGLKALKDKNPEKFTVIVDDFNNITDIAPITAPAYGRKLPKEKFIVYSFSKLHENVFGTARLRALYQWWWIKQVMIRAMGVYMEKFGMPLPFGQFPIKFTPTQQTAYLKALKNLRFEHAIIAPEGTKLDFIEASGKGPEGFLEIIRHADERMQSLIEGQTLTGGTADGSNTEALGSVHQDTQDMYLEDLGEDLADKPIAYLIKYLVDINFSGVVKYPKFKFNPISEENLVATIAPFIQAVSLGLVMPTPEDEQHVREILKFPKAQGADANDQSPNSTVPRVPVPSIIPDPKDLPRAGSHKPTPSSPGLPANYAEGGLLRKHTKYEDKMDFFSVKSALDAAEKALAPETAKVLRSSVDKLKKDAAVVLANKDIEGVKHLQMRNKGEFNAVVRTQLQSVAMDAFKDSRREMRAAHFADVRPLPPKKVLELVAARSFKITGVVSNEITSRIQEQVLLGIKNGKGYEAMASDIEDSLADFFSKDPDAGDELAYLDGPRIRTIARTNISEAYNEAKKSSYLDPDLDGLVVAFQYSAILDPRVRETHEAMDGVVRPFDDAIWDKWTPPNGYNCRCTIVPITKYEEYEVTDKLPKVEPDKGFK